MLAVASEEGPGAAQALHDDWYARASEAERRAATSVIDHNAAEITCPACGTTFATGPAECLDCGLGLM